MRCATSREIVLTSVTVCATVGLTYRETAHPSYQGEYVVPYPFGVLVRQNSLQSHVSSLGSSTPSDSLGGASSSGDAAQSEAFAPSRATDLVSLLVVPLQTGQSSSQSVAECGPKGPIRARMGYAIAARSSARATYGRHRGFSARLSGQPLRVSFRASSRGLPPISQSPIRGTPLMGSS